MDNFEDGLLAEMFDVPDLLARRAAKVAAVRQAAADAIAEIEEQRAIDTEAACNAYAIAEREYNEAFTRFRAAERARGAAYRARAVVGVRAQIAAKPHEKIMMDTADPAIVALLDKIGDAYQQPPSGTTQPMQAARWAAITELREVWREALTTDELAARLARIRRSAVID